MVVGWVLGLHCIGAKVATAGCGKFTVEVEAFNGGKKASVRVSFSFSSSDDETVIEANIIRQSCKQSKRYLLCLLF